MKKSVKFNKFLLISLLFVIFIIGAIFLGTYLVNNFEKSLSSQVIKENLIKDLNDQTNIKNMEYVNENGEVVSNIESVEKGFIVEFNDVPLIIKEKELKNRNKFLQYKKNYIFNREEIKNNIKKKLGKEPKIIYEYKNIFNGIAVEISKEDADKIKEMHGIKSVKPDLKVEANLMDSVDYIKTNYAWNMGYTGNGIKIGIIDTGVDYSHLDLGGCTKDQFLSGTCSKVIGGYDFVNNDNDPMDDQGHGTHVAGIASGTGNGGLKGVAPDAKIYTYKVLNSGGSGTFSQVMSGIERSFDPNQDGDYSDHLDIISLSLGAICGTYSPDCGPDDPMSTTIDNAVNAGIIAVIAAGNSGPNARTIGSPGTARKAITVGAVYKKDYNGTYWGDVDPKKGQITSFSSRGPVEWDSGYLIKPDIVAPGAIICSAQYDSAWNTYKCFDDKHVQISGTSMATPHVAGAAALIKQAHPGWTPLEIKELIKVSATDLNYDSNTQGRGLIDIEKAINIQEKPPIADISIGGKFLGVREINITGTATGNNFKNFSLYYITENDFINKTNNWIYLYTSYTPVENNLLYKWDVSGLSDNKYILKLVVSGNIRSEAMNAIKLINTEITSPSSIFGKSFLDITTKVIFGKGEKIIIKGTATGDNFKNYSISWCKSAANLGYEVSPCTSAGVVLTNNGNSPVLNDVLGYIDVPLNVSTEYYFIKLINNYNNQAFQTKSKIYIDGELHEGWPIKIPGKCTGQGSCLSVGKNPTIGDINNDSKKEIIFYYDDLLHVFYSNGFYLPGFPVNISANYNGYASMSIADVDNDGFNEAIFVDLSNMYIVKGDGRINKTNIGYLPSGITIDDLNNDGKYEFIFLTEDTIKVLDNNRSYFPGFPKTLAYQGSSFLNTNHVSVGDINGDGNKEIVASYNKYNYSEGIYKYFNFIFVLDSIGNILPGWPKVYNYAGEFIYPEVILADINKDNKKEILFIENISVHALDLEGNEISGFPFKISNNHRLGSFIVGDFDLNGNINIVIGSLSGSKDCLNNYEYLNSVLTNLTSPICKLDILNEKVVYRRIYNSGLQAGNLDYTGNQIATLNLAGSSIELVNFEAFNLNRTFANKFPKKLDESSWGIAPIGDTDGDGKNEILAYTFFTGNLYMWDTDGNPGLNLWPLYHHDERLTGCADCGTYANPPTAPSNLISTAKTSSTISLSWSLSTSEVGVLGYLIYRNGVNVGASTTNSYTDSGLNALTNYSYYITAYDINGKVSNPSNIISVTTNQGVIKCSSDSGCGTSGYFGSTFCYNNNVYQNYTRFICNSPGTAQSFCTNVTSGQLRTTCGYGCLNGNCSPGTSDITPPVITITSPVNNSVFSIGRNVNIITSAGDISGIKSIAIYIDSSNVKTCSSATCSYKWNTRRVGVGNHIIKVNAVDNSINLNSGNSFVFVKII